MLITKFFSEFLEKLKTRKEVLCSGESAIIVAGKNIKHISHG